jgi:lipase ATG15
LDITADFIKVHGLDSDISINEHEQVWTTRYQNQSPWIVNLPIKSNIIKMKRLANRDPAFVDSYLEFARLNPVLSQEISLEWDDDLVDAPNVTDKETIISLALMSSNAYVGIPQTGDWRDVNFNSSFSHGWNGTGVRGHVFVSDDNSTVVIAYKGTSAAYLTGSGDDATVVEDKENDNLLFSCCCARISYIWTTVCDCYKSSYTCDQSCLEKELYRKDKYFHAALNVYKNVSAQYPDSNIWLTGHSLGGALSSLVGRTYGLPAVGFESPGDLLATKRLHLPMPPGLPEYMEGIWHFGHTADPIFMGVCNGASSSCSVAGYAMETQCHSGRQCIYDVVTDKGWHVNMLNHRIHTVIDDIIEVYNETARCVDAPPCSDCFNWRFVSDDDGYKDKKPDRTRTTSVVETPAPTNAPKCIKKTWYGRCLEYEDDEI